MAKVTLYNQTGNIVGELELDARVFGVKPNASLVHEAVVAQTANSRQVLAHTKTRSEVAGTGQKPWKQKGTGRARHGSRRSPIWVGGGITFGPRSDRNFTVKMNRKARQKALTMVLSDKVAQNHFVAMESIPVTDAKTRTLVAMLKSLPVAGKKVLLVLESANRATARAAQNLPKVNAIPVQALNIVELLAHDYILTSKEAIDWMTKTYTRASSKE